MKLFSKFVGLFKIEEKIFLTIIFLMSFIVVFLETLGVTMLPIIFTKILDDESIKIFEKIPDFFSNFINIFDNNLGLIVLMVSLFFFKAFFNYFHFVCEYIVLKRIRIRLLDDWIKKILQEDYLSIQKTSVSYKIWYSSLIELSTGIISNFINLSKGIIITISIFFVIILFSPKILITFYFLILITIIFFYFYVSRKIYNYGKLVSLAQRDKIEILQSIFVGIKNLIIYKKQPFFQREFLKKNLIKEKNSQMGAFIGNIPNYFLEFVGVLFICLYFLIILNQSVPKSELIFNLGLVSYGSLRILSYFKLIANNVSQIKARKFQIETFVNTTSSLNNGKKIFYNNSNFNTNLPNNIILTIKDLSFGYDNNNLIEIKDYKFKKNKFYLIIGESGLGKTTLLDLMLDIAKTKYGKINFSIDSKKIGYVSQECFLLNDTIKKNIAFGESDELIDNRKINDVIKRVNLLNFIDKFPDKLNYKIENNGSNISIGQKQRIGIARALYLDPELIFFDEPTSSLDEDNENIFLDTIENIKKTATIIMVTHKYKNINNFDYLLELKNKSLVEKIKKN